MTMRKMFLVVAALLGLAAFSAIAQEAQIRQALESKLGGAKIEGVLATPVPGIYEVRVQGHDGPQIYYVNAAATHIFAGNLIELKGNRNLTEERMRKLTAVEFNSLPLDQAVKIQRGGGKRVMAMFSDPYCPYCRRFEQTLLQMDDITVYVFMYPVIRPEKADHSRAVWCSKDRAKAWLDLAAAERPVVPEAAPTCANPVDKILELGRSLRVNGTPTLFFANGERAGGGMEVGKLRAKLDEISRQPTKKN
jgi:thiol:disulfide interchange protein DsbC